MEVLAIWVTGVRGRKGWKGDGYWVFNCALKGECNFDHWAERVLQGACRTKALREDEHGYWETQWGSWPGQSVQGDAGQEVPAGAGLGWMARSTAWGRKSLCDLQHDMCFREMSGMGCRWNRRMDSVIHPTRGFKVPDWCRGQGGREHRSLQGTEKAIDRNSEWQTVFS